MTRLLLSLAGLTFVYSMILLSLHPWDLAIGAIAAIGVVLLFRHHLFGDGLGPVVGFWQRVFALPRFVWAVYVEMMEGLWLVFSIVLGRRSLIRSGIVAVPMGEQSANGVAVTAWLVGLSPGSVVIDVDWNRRIMWIHFIDVTDPDELRLKMQMFYERYQRQVFP
jgi:multisubunit Na+/H+ antiporter MnhE subunit